MTPFNKFVLVLLAFRDGVEGVDESGMKPESARETTKSILRVVISRIVENEIKFYTAVSVAVIMHLFISLLRRTFSLHYRTFLQSVGVHIRHRP
jgi:hypothetical protein